MDFDYSQKTRDYLARLTAFMDEHVYPNEHLYHQQIDEAPSRWSWNS
jgi:acyl-CoA dehydrogenase